MAVAPVFLPGEVAEARASVRGIDSGIGKSFAHARRSAGVSQVGIARALGVTTEMIRGYERGRYRMSAGTLVVVSRMIGCSVEDICTGGAV